MVETLCASLAHTRLQALSDQDSNLDQQGQNLPCYRLHYPRMFLTLYPGVEPGSHGYIPLVCR